MKRDDIIEYSLDAHHSEEEGVKIRKNIYLVTVILTVVTIIEVAMGLILKKSEFLDSPETWNHIKTAYVILTLVKAGYIVMVFMHLGDERKSWRWIILVPYIFFMLYILFIIMMDALPA